MSGLSDREIREMFDTDMLGVEPEPNWDEQLQPASLDLRLGRSFRQFKLGMPPERRIIDLSEGPANDFMSASIVEGDQPFILEPDRFALATTIETIAVPLFLRARVDGRSSYGRLGVLVHATAGFIDPGFRGEVTLELRNVGYFPVALYPGTRICQVSFDRLGSPAVNGYKGKYQGQMGATPSQAHLDHQQKEE